MHLLFWKDRRCGKGRGCMLTAKLVGQNETGFIFFTRPDPGQERRIGLGRERIPLQVGYDEFIALFRRRFRTR
jgi:hypothetical protein